jgi:hypothetical protein
MYACPKNDRIPNRHNKNSETFHKSVTNPAKNTPTEKPCITGKNALSQNVSTLSAGYRKGLFPCSRKSFRKIIHALLPQIASGCSLPR